MTIKYIVHTTSSYSDLNGNTYHFARITRTSTGKSLVITEVGGTTNAVHLLFDQGNKDGSKPLEANWSEIYSVQVWEKRREWERMRNFANGFDGSDISGTVSEWKVTPAMIRALSRKANPGQRNANANVG